ncbi:MAG TPA: hypothetical protein VGF76_11990 [Polyangiaceae bacterium]|jgi:uncharacterized repeat protein (TIGR03806 family)
MNSHLRATCALGLAVVTLLVTSCSSQSTSDTGASAGNGGSAGASKALGMAGVSGAGAAGSDAESVTPGECAPPVEIDAPFSKLSQTGCMDATDPTKLAARVIPYEVNSPLWSDSADKLRGMVVPAGKTVHVLDCALEPESCSQGPADTGKWVFPVGTVMVKSFLFDGKLVETRLFVRHDEQTWVGYSYQWDEAQTDATLVPDQRRAVMFDTGSRTVPWNYPSRTDCMKCHNSEGGSTLGPETRQMNRVVNGSNQLDQLASLGLFDRPPASPYQAALVTPYPGQLGSPPASATRGDKARSYLSANCAFCHRPDGDFPNLDLRFDTAFEDMHLCNVAPEKGDVGVPTATNLTPGDPMHSITWLRMNALPNEGRMPQIGTYQIDNDGVQLIGDWISAIQSCP